MSGDPFPKSRQLARGEKRYRRKVASPKQWQALHAAKQGPCRLCTAPTTGLHHLVARDHFGDDVADNLVPVCHPCHRALHVRDNTVVGVLLRNLTDAEYAYMVERGGENYAERVYGIECQR